jgi:hypothetical protein
MAWYEAGELVVTHSIVEDRVTTPADLEGYQVDTAALAITQQREGCVACASTSRKCSRFLVHS